MKRKFLAAVLSVLMLLGAAVPALAATDSETFVFVTSGEVNTLDPARSYDTASGEVIHQVYDTLLGLKDGSPDDLMPLLATEVPSVENGLISEDGRTIRFPIRKGVKFHNGAELTPEDVEYTFERAMLADPAGGPIWMFFEPLLGVQTMRDVIAMAGGPRDFANVNDVDPAILRAAYDIVDATVEVDGDYVVFNLVAPYPPFLQILAKGGSWGAIINKEWTVANGGWDGNPDTWQNWYNLAKEEMALYNKAMGTGAFKLQAWDLSAGQVVLQRFDEYWRGPAKLRTVFIKYINEESTRLLMLQNGEADAATVSAPMLGQVEAMRGVVVQKGLPYLGNAALFFNWSIPIEGNEDLVGSGKLDGRGIPSDFFADADVRKAFNYAFDYESYIEQVAMGLGSKPYGVAPAILEYVDTTQPWYDYDLDKAEEHFRKAFNGELWEKGFKVTLLYNTGNDQRKTAAEILEANIEMLNPKFQVEVQGMQWSTYLDKLAMGSLPVFFMGWLADFADVHNFYVAYMHSAGAFAGYCGEALMQTAKEKYDPVIARGINATSDEERAAAYAELQRLAYEDAVVMPYVDSQAIRVYRDWVKGFEFNPAYSANYDFYSIWK